MQRKFFCKNHNQLCCTACITKIKGKEYGQHTDCDICIIEDIKNEKKALLKENIKNLDNLSNNIQELINNLKILFEEINKNKEDSKNKIIKIFTKIRSELNNREEELLKKIDEEYENLNFNNDIIKKSEKLPDKIKLSLNEGKSIDNNWNINNNKLNLLMNNCINIETNIKEIIYDVKNINKFNDIINYKIEFETKDIKSINDIKYFGEISCKKILRILSDSLIINKNKVFIESLISWINPENEITTNLLYRKSIDGDSYDTFHRLCDNKGPTSALIKSTEGFIKYFI